MLKAIPSGLSHLVKCHLTFSKSVTTKEPDLILDGINILSKKCNNKHFYWGSFIECIDG